MKIHLDQNICIGDGSCAMLAGKTFKLNDDGKAYILATPDAPGSTDSAEMTADMDPREEILEAARACPVQAIKLFEDDGTEIAL